MRIICYFRCLFTRSFQRHDCIQSRVGVSRLVATCWCVNFMVRHLTSGFKQNGLLELHELQDAMEEKSFSHQPRMKRLQNSIMAKRKKQVNA